MEARLARGEAGRDPFLPQRGRPPRRGAFFVHFVDKPLALMFATFCATSATASFMAYHFHDLSPYVLIGNPLTLTVIELFAVPGALLGTALYPLGLDAPVWLYVGAGIRFILWVARFIAAAPGSTLHLRRLRAVRAAVSQSRGDQRDSVANWTFRAMAIPFAAIGVIGAVSGAHYDAIVAPSGDLAAVRDADGRLQVVGKRFNAFDAEQWLTADGDGRDPATARDPDAPCDRVGCVAALPEGQSLSVGARSRRVRGRLRARRGGGHRADRAGRLRGLKSSTSAGSRSPAPSASFGTATRFVVAADRVGARGSPLVAGAQAAR